MLFEHLLFGGLHQELFGQDLLERHLLLLELAHELNILEGVNL
jgi:hypothetical protein